jgi:hypothetical protein
VWGPHPLVTREGNKTPMTIEQQGQIKEKT